jgi:hypothetical protein
VLLDLIQRALHPPFRVRQQTTLKLHKEDILEGHHLRGSAVDARQVQLVVAEAIQHVRERAGGAVVDGKRDQGLGRARRGRLLPGAFSQDEEPRFVVLAVLDALGQDVQAVHLCCETAGDCGAGARGVCLDHLGGSARGTDIHPLDALQVCSQEYLALPEGLGVGVDTLDVFDARQWFGSGLEGTWSPGGRCRSARYFWGICSRGFPAQQVVTDI